MAKKNNLANPIFHDETAARQWFEGARWPNGPICPKCKGEKHYATKKAGVYRCAAPTCRKDFTVTTGTVMERSHVKLTQWAAAFHLYASSKKGLSALQLHRELGCEYNTAWFMFPPHQGSDAARRSRRAEDGRRWWPRRNGRNLYGYPRAKRLNKNLVREKHPVLTLLDRDDGKVRSFHIDIRRL